MTAEEFFAWANRPENEGKWYEPENGEVVETHPSGEALALVGSCVITLLTDYIRRRGAGHLLTNDYGLVVRRGPDTVLGPAVMFFPESRQLDQAGRGHVEWVP